MRFSRVATIFFLLLSFQAFAKNYTQIVLTIWTGPEAGSTHPLPDVYVSDENGHASKTNGEGILDISQMKGNLYLLTSNDDIFFEDQPERVLLGEKDFLGGQIDVGGYVEQEYIVPRLFLQEAINLVRDEYGISLPYILQVNTHFGEGCNAGWDGSQLLFSRKENDCISSGFSRDITVHEFGHALLQMSLGRMVDSDYNEGFADALMTLLTDDPVFAEGFYPSRTFSYIRDINNAQPYPEGWRGQYSGSLIFSKLVFESYQQLSLTIGKEKARTLAMKSLLSLVHNRQIFSDADPHLKYSSKEFVRDLSERLELGTPVEKSLSCVPHLLLIETGFVTESGGCEENNLYIDNSLLAYDGKGVVSRDGDYVFPVLKDSKKGLATKLADRELYEEIFVEATLNVSIPYHLAFDNPLTLYFDLRSVLSRYEVLGAQLSLKMNHIFPDDLRLAYGASKDKALYKGIEEMQLPAYIKLDVAESERNNWTFSFWDSAETFDGDLIELPKIKLIVSPLN